MTSGFQCAGCGEWNKTSVDPSTGSKQTYVEVCCRIPLNQNRAGTRSLKAYIVRLKWLLLLALFLPTTMTGTTIVIIRTASGFVVAADSRLSDNNNRALLGLGCKVFEAGNGMVWGLAGFMGAQAFRPIDVIRPLIVGSDVEVVSEEVKGVVVPLLTKEAINLRRSAPQRFNYLLHGNDMFSVFVISKRRAIVQGFSVQATSGSNIRVVQTGSIDCDISVTSCAEGKIIRLGQYAEIDEFVPNHKETMKQFASYTNMARFLVQLEIDANPQQVGSPIDIVEIDGEGIHWKERKPECERK